MGTPEAFLQLEQLETQLRKLNGAASASEEALQNGQLSPAQVRDSLAQLEAELEKLQCKGIDSVSFDGLSEEDAEVARSWRRRLTRQVEQLQTRMDAAFERIRAFRGK